MKQKKEKQEKKEKRYVLSEQIQKLFVKLSEEQINEWLLEHLELGKFEKEKED